MGLVVAGIHLDSSDQRAIGPQIHRAVRVVSLKLLNRCLSRKTSSFGIRHQNRAPELENLNPQLLTLNQVAKALVEGRTNTLLKNKAGYTLHSKP